MLIKLPRVFLVTATLFLISCGGGGGSGDSLSTNQCSALGLNTKIINGTECSTGGSPVLALNLVNRDGTGSLCSATVITANQLLTAAHCFVTKPVLSAFVEVDGNRIYGSKVHVHPQANVNESQGTAVNDVAILDLEENVNRPTVALLTSTSPAIGDRFAIFGFGLDSYGQLGELRSGEMRINNIDFNYIVANYEGDGSNTCNGDSGGPAIFTLSNGTSAVFGVTSSGTAKDCQIGDHSYFANIQLPIMANFIRSVAPGARTE